MPPVKGFKLMRPAALITRCQGTVVEGFSAKRA
jgi:hypothetical protein